LRAYRAHIHELLKKDNGRGQYVVIQGHEIVCLFPDIIKAVEFAREYLSNGRQFLIKQITPIDPVQCLGGATLEPAVEGLW
jgi:hypothetical protein